MFGWWTTTGPERRRMDRNTRLVPVVCACGNISEVDKYALLHGKTKSCGCYRGQWTKDNRTTHGKSFTPEHITWKGIRARCNNPKNHAFKWYGGRGITVCKRWDKFENFFSDMGLRPAGKSLGRINNNGPYSPENCRWESELQQKRNFRKNRFVVYKGYRRCIADWAERTGINQSLIIWRLNRGWGSKRALTNPVRGKPLHEVILG